MALHPLESGRFTDIVHFSTFFLDDVDEKDGVREENNECNAVRSDVWIACLRAFADGDEGLSTADIDGLR